MILTHHLHLDAFGTYVIEHKFCTRNSLCIDPASDSNWYVLAKLSFLERAIFLDEFSQVRVDMELMRIGIWVFRVPQFLDPCGTNLKVLLESNQHR